MVLRSGVEPESELLQSPAVTTLATSAYLVILSHVYPDCLEGWPLRNSSESNLVSPPRPSHLCGSSRVRHFQIENVSLPTTSLFLWTRQDLNLRLLRCKRSTLAAELRVLINLSAVSNAWHCLRIVNRMP